MSRSFPSSPPASQGQLAAAQDSLGINWSSDTPFGNTRLVLNCCFQVIEDLPSSPARRRQQASTEEKGGPLSAPATPELTQI